MSTPVDYSNHPRRTHEEVIFGLIDPAGKSVLDIGCGGGAWMQIFADRGAEVTGLEISEFKAAKARALGAGEVQIGFAESLPFADRSFDVVLFMNSLHHVAVHSQTAAIDEGLRALRPDGAMLIIEPIAGGARFEVRRPVDDETVIRTAAFNAIRSTVSEGRAHEDAETVYVIETAYPSFDEFIARFVAVEPELREPLVAENRARLIDRFERLGRRTEDGHAFDQPYRATLLRHPTAPEPSA